MNNDHEHHFEFDADDSAHLVDVEEFKLPKETIRTQLAEILRTKQVESETINQICNIIATEMRLEEEAIRAEGMRALLNMVVDHDHPMLAFYQLCFAAGMITRQTGPELAKKCGVSKQAFQQGVDKYVSELSARSTRTMRAEGSKVAMSISNYRHAVNKPKKS